jgi:hypothetical protein
MSLYNMLFGVNPFSGILLSMLGTEPGAIPRFRDCFLSDDGQQIVIYTRTGGGNRDYYEDAETRRSNFPEDFEGEETPCGPWNDDLRCLPGFVRDEDDDFDCTYARFYYDVAEPFRAQIELLSNLGGVVNPAQRWEEMLNGLKSGDTSRDDVQRAIQVGEALFGQIKKAFEGREGEDGTV